MAANTNRGRFMSIGFLAGLVLPMAAAGCQLFSDAKIASPLTFQQQMDEIYRVAPKGTPRDEAVARLQKAGITGEYAPHVDKRFPHDPHVFYCQFHEQKDGTRRQMTVAILFNERRELYGVTLTDLTELPNASSGSASTGPTPNGAASGTGFPSNRSAIPLPQSAGGTSQPSPDSHNPRLGNRTPFADR